MENQNSDLSMEPPFLLQMSYQGNYTETINRKMRVPDTITVAEPDDSTNNHNKAAGDFYHSNGARNYNHPAFNMEVPERIVVSVGEQGAQYEQGETVLPSSSYPDVTSPSSVALRTPPRVLTLQDSNLDCLDVNASKSSTLNDSPTSSANMNALVDEPLNDISTLEDFDDVTIMRKQVFKLHKRIDALEQQQANRVKVDYCVYGVTLALWVLNGWFLYANRRLY